MMNFNAKNTLSENVGFYVFRHFPTQAMSVGFVGFLFREPDNPTVPEKIKDWRTP